MTHKPLTSLPRSARPRERLLEFGAEHLTESELLAIILGSGTKRQNVLKLSEKVLIHHPLHKLSLTTEKELQKIKGIGSCRAAKIVACTELAVRLSKPDPQATIQSTKDAAKICYQLLKSKQTEHVAVLGLNGRNHIIVQQIIAVGTVNAAHLHPRDVFTPVLQAPCTSIIMTHNHPSGDVSPSEDDYQCTQKIKQAGELLGIPLIDHVIVARDNYFSFREAEVL